MDSAPPPNERLRACLYCGKPAVGRSMKQHIAQTVDAVHGEVDTLPEDFRLEKCPIINTDDGEAEVRQVDF